MFVSTHIIKIMSFLLIEATSRVLIHACMYVHMYDVILSKSMHTYRNVSVCASMHTYVRIHIMCVQCAHVYVFTYIYTSSIHIYIYTYVCKCIQYLHTCVYICVYTCLCILYVCTCLAQGVFAYQGFIAYTCVRCVQLVHLVKH